MPPHFNKPKVTGFTLIEVLVAMSVFAIMSVMAYGGLESVIRSHDQTRAGMKRLQQIQMTMLNLQRDFEQINSRHASDELGGQLLSLNTTQNQDWLVQFTRNGWNNPAKLPRSNLQRVAYRLEEGDDTNQLMRIYWPYVDRASDDQAVEKMLIDNVKSVKIRFLDSKRKWQEQWPPVNASPDASLSDTPGAIEFTLELEDWGEIKRLFRVAG